MKVAVPYSRPNLIISRLNFENISISFGAMRVQHTDRQTDRQTDRHTYIHTDRQTEPNYYIDEMKNV